MLKHSGFHHIILMCFHLINRNFIATVCGYERDLIFPPILGILQTRKCYFHDNHTGKRVIQCDFCTYQNIKLIASCHCYSHIHIVDTLTIFSHKIWRACLLFAVHASHIDIEINGRLSLWLTSEHVSEKLDKLLNLGFICPAVLHLSLELHDTRLDEPVYIFVFQPNSL